MTADRERRCTCGGVMKFSGRQALHMNGSPFFLESSTEFTQVDVYVCPDCRKVEFYLPELPAETPCACTPRRRRRSCGPFSRTRTIRRMYTVGSGGFWSSGPGTRREPVIFPRLLLSVGPRFVVAAGRRLPPHPPHSVRHLPPRGKVEGDVYPVGAGVLDGPYVYETF